MYILINTFDKSITDYKNNEKINKKKSNIFNNKH